MKITFYGAARTVTGSKHLLTTGSGKQILLDCGLFQGNGKLSDEKNRHFGFQPSQVDAVILSHAHIDHSGNLPRLVKEGFTGKIYCTPATRDLCSLMLEDSARIHESDINYLNRKRAEQGKEPLKPLYTEKDVKRCMKHFYEVPYYNPFYIDPDFSFTFSDAGHILGSAVIHISWNEDNQKKTLCFTGDVGRSSDLILKAPDPCPQSDYIICESTYGNRLHDPVKDAEQKLLQVVLETCVERKGKLLIPAFSLGRTQEVVYTLDRLKTAGLLPPVKVFVDSPLSTNATEIMRAHPEGFNENIRKYMEQDPDPFGFNNLHYIREYEESKALNSFREPCIIIAASGMMDAGRIKHHLKNNIHNPDNTLLLVGFVPPGSLGYRLLKGAERVSIFGEEHSVKIMVRSIQSYSAHADYQELQKFLANQDIPSVKRVFLVHGEEDAVFDFKIKLMEQGFKDVVIPSEKESFILS